MLTEFAEDGIDYLIEKSGNEEYIEPFLDNKDSFVIPVERIVSIEKHGELVSLLDRYSWI